MKLIFMGTPGIAAACLEALIHSRHEILAVITQPDQKSGRGLSVTYSPVKDLALTYDIPCFQPEKVGEEEFLDFLRQKKADVFCVAAYAQKLPDELLAIPPNGCINMHPSLLPLYRGSGPLRGPILNGDDKSGVTIMQINSQWDAGDILLQEAFPLEEDETSQTLEEKCARLGARLMVRAVDGLEEGTIEPVPQDPQKATYLKQIKKEDGLIDFSKDACEIERQVRACIPWPSAYNYLNGKVFKIWKAQAIGASGEETAEPSIAHAIVSIGQDNVSRHQTACGTVVYADKKMFLIATGNGYLRPLQVQLEGKKRMETEDFLRGSKIDTGFVFGK